MTRDHDKAILRPVPRTFYDRDVLRVARDLLGLCLVRDTDEGLTVGRVVEVEAYLARDDPANHAFRGLTKRNATMFGPPGHAYVYAIHSRWCLNAVTEPPGVPSAVLIRAVEPLVGLDLMHRRRCRRLSDSRAALRSQGKSATRTRRGCVSAAKEITPRDLARGPARLCEAFAIDRSLDGWDLTRGEVLWITDAPDDWVLAACEPLAEHAPAPRQRQNKPQIVAARRVGVSSAQDLLLRFFLADNPFVSKPRVR